MTIDERLQFLLTSTESLHASTQEPHAAALKHDKQLADVALKLHDVVDSINSLARIAGIH